MHKTLKPVLKTLVGQAVKHNPVWLMRQAGRYLPEYRALRASSTDFLDLCLTPSKAAEITLQPIRRFGMDAAILFADILLVPHAMGQQLAYREGEGPVLEPVQDEKALAMLSFDLGKLDPVFETLERVKPCLPETTALMGFCGGPWTVACYMIEGRGKNAFKRAVTVAHHQPEFLEKLLDDLHHATLAYLSRQIESGAEVVQIFESWGGLLTDEKFRRWVIEPTRRLVQALEAKYPEVPVLGFPRGATPADYQAYVMQTGIDGLSIDQHVPLSFAAHQLQVEKPLQGNLAPEILVEGGDKMMRAVEHILETLGRNHIFNLGHGVLPETPPENVAELVRLVREAEWDDEDSAIAP